jgi:tetratricopeptide (TPR) repeat protein
MFSLSLRRTLGALAFALATATTVSATAETYDPDNITAISQYMELLAKGSERYNAKDTTTAIDTYRQAIQLSPKNGLGYFLLAEAYVGSGNLPEAEAAIAQAQENVEAKNVQLRSKVLFLAADLAERQKKWEQAKVAWQAYIDHAAKAGPNAGAFPQTGTGRLKAIQRALDLDKAYAAVRERIQAERDAAKAAPPKK